MAGWMRGSRPSSPRRRPSVEQRVHLARRLAAAPRKPLPHHVLILRGGWGQNGRPLLSLRTLLGRRWSNARARDARLAPAPARLALQLRQAFELVSAADAADGAVGHAGPKKAGRAWAESGLGEGMGWGRGGEGEGARPRQSAAAASGGCGGAHQCCHLELMPRRRPLWGMALLQAEHLDLPDLASARTGGRWCWVRGMMA